MMLAVDAGALRDARAAGRALVGFSIYNLEQGLGVLRAAEAEGVAVLLQAGSSAFRYAGMEPLAMLAMGLARSARVPVGVHLDHATDIAEIESCLALGYTSVMFDGSALPFEENVRLTQRVVLLAHGAGAWVEAELAGIAGDEDESTVAHAPVQKSTDPDLAAEFVARTNVDALAVAVGNVHGIPAAPVALDLDRLESIASTVAVPLVLHGASGLPDHEVRAAIALGVAKVNVNAELRRAFCDGLAHAGTTPPSGDALPVWLAPAIDAVQIAAQKKLRTLSPGAALATEGPRS
jgi:tagatose 1,6-diphosphate aldolase GatY/KbaY